MKLTKAQGKDCLRAAKAIAMEDEPYTEVESVSSDSTYKALNEIGWCSYALGYDRDGALFLVNPNPYGKGHPDSHEVMTALCMIAAIAGAKA